MAVKFKFEKFQGLWCNWGSKFALSHWLCTWALPQCRATALPVILQNFNSEILFAARCSASHPGCETIWNTDVRQLYSILTTGTLGRDELQTFCRFVFLQMYNTGYADSDTLQTTKLMNGDITYAMSTCCWSNTRSSADAD